MLFWNLSTSNFQRFLNLQSVSNLPISNQSEKTQSCRSETQIVVVAWQIRTFAQRLKKIQRIFEWYSFLKKLEIWSEFFCIY